MPGGRISDARSKREIALRAGLEPLHHVHAIAGYDFALGVHEKHPRMAQEEPPGLHVALTSQAAIERTAGLRRLL